MLGRNLVLCLGSAAILVGFIFMLVPILGDACGNAFAGNDVSSYLDSGISDGVCSTARVDRWMYVAPMLLGGIAALLAAINASTPLPKITEESAATPGSSVTEG